MIGNPFYLIHCLASYRIALSGMKPTTAFFDKASAKIFLYGLRVAGGHFSEVDWNLEY
jgi:hypothetical protein